MKTMAMVLSAAQWGKEEKGVEEGGSEQRWETGCIPFHYRGMRCNRGIPTDHWWEEKRRVGDERANIFHLEEMQQVGPKLTATL